MKYGFEVRFCTDGDFGFPYVPRSMTFDGDDYWLRESFDDREKANDSIETDLRFLKQQLDTSRDYVREDVQRCINDFLDNFKQHENYASYMYGNYDGTIINFFTVDDTYRAILLFDEDEHNKIAAAIGTSNLAIKRFILDKIAEKEMIANDKDSTNRDNT